jgi:hypothetical protein
VAAEDRSAAAELRREERVAALVVDRFRLSPPVDLRKVADAYADIEEDSIPGACDGLVVGLTGSRPRPLILLKGNRPRRRQRFTLAHELGHILLPWHLGASYLCNTGRSFDEEGYFAASAESQANRFAAHLLVPSRWLADLYASAGTSQVGPLMDALDEAQVSAHVACLRLLATLPAGHVFAIVSYGGEVLLSGKTGGVGGPPPPKGELLDGRWLDRFAMRVEDLRYGSNRVIWWTFRGDGDTEEADADPRSSREVLDNLLARHVAPAEEHYIRQSLGGVIGSENSMARNENVRGRDALYVRFRARFAQARAYPDALREDPEFDLWLQKRAADLGE